MELSNQVGASDEEWDAFLASHPDGYHEQTSGYGRNREKHGYRCERVVVREADRIVAGAQVLSRRTPIGTLGLVLRAPLVAEQSPTLLAQIIGELDRHAGARSLASLRVETLPTQLELRTALKSAGFQSGEAWAEVLMRSIGIRLDASDDELLARMKKRGRYNIKLAQRSGVTVQVGDARSVEQFFELHQATASFHGFPTFPREYFEYLRSLFGPTGKAQVFVAHHGQKPIAAIFNLVMGGRLYYCWGGMSREPEHEKLCASYPLHFTAMTWARDRGCTHYDLSGVSEFKEKLGHLEIEWDLPLWKYYGVVPRFRRSLANTTWTRPRLRRIVQQAAYRLGHRKRIPH